MLAVVPCFFNLAAEQLGPEYTAVAWIDSDVWFSNPNCATVTRKATETNDVVQMFDKCVWISPLGESERWDRDYVGYCERVPNVNVPRTCHRLQRTTGRGRNTSDDPKQHYQKA